MRDRVLWLPLGLLGALFLTIWGGWTYRLHQHNLALANALEAERQRAFVDLAYHVEQIQSLLGKGLVTGNTKQNMRYMADVTRHASAANSAFSTLPLPTNLSAGTGKFLQQVGDFSLSLLRNEAVGRSMGERERAELQRLRQSSTDLSQHLNQMMAEHNEGGVRWHPPAQLSVAGLLQGPTTPTRATTPDQVAATLSPGWEQVSTAMEKMPVFIYDGPFSDHVGQAEPAMAGSEITQEQATGRLAQYLPGGVNQLRTVGVTELGGNLPAYSFQLAPQNGANGADLITVEITRKGGHLLNLLNSRRIEAPKLNLDQARAAGQAYLAAIGLPNMQPTYGQVQEGSATVAYAYQEGNLLIYPDQVKVKVALDNGEILAVDTRPYLMNHKPRPPVKARLRAEQAQVRLNPGLQVQRVRLALVPDPAGTGELLTYEFLTQQAEQSYLVYINAETGEEEQVLQLIETDGGTFAL